MTTELLIWLSATWGGVAFLLCLVRGYMQECFPSNDFCDDGVVPLIVIWPFVLVLLAIVGVVIGPFCLAKWIGRFIGKRCGCGRRRKAR